MSHPDHTSASPAGRTRAALVMLGAIGATLATGAADPAHAAGTHAQGMGGAAIAVPDPVLSGRDNPAFLGVAGSRGFRMTMFDVGLALGNSAFSLDDYTTYNGATLTEEDEDVILDSVGDEGWTLGALAEGSGPTVAFGSIAFGARAIGYGGGRIPREVLELVFDGNVLGESVDFSSATGGGWAAAEVHVATGFDLGHRYGGSTGVGVRARYLRGLWFAGVIHSEGRITTAVDSLYGSAALDLRTATGGSGYALDLGVVHNRDRWNLGLRIEGLLASMRWSSGTEIRRFVAETDASDLIDLGGDGTTDENGVDTREERLAAAAFSSRPPLRMGVGAAYQLDGWIFAGDVDHTALGLSVGEDPWRISAGVERLLFGRALSLRAGSVVGGRAGPAVTGGFTTQVGPWRFDLDAGTYATLSPSAPKGLRIAIGSALVFG